MLLRDQIAIQAMQALISNSEIFPETISLAKSNNITPEQLVAQSAYKFANEMLRVREPNSD